MKLKTIILAVMTVFFSQPAFAAFDSADKQKQLKITRVTPGGEDIPARNQIVFQFNRPVVPVGRMERDKSEIPVEISPQLDCQWRWLNRSSLACELNDENKLQPSTRYTIVMNPGIKAEDGATISDVYTHDFITQRPRVNYVWLHNWQSPGTPVIRVAFNQEVSKSSVAEHIAFVYQSNGEDKADIVQDIKVEKAPYDEESPRYIVVPGEKYVLDFGPEGSKDGDSSKIDDKSGEKEEARRIWLVSPQKELPLDTGVELKVSPGLVSALGQETGIEKRVLLDFHTFPEFAFLGVTCNTNNHETILITTKNTDEIGKCNPLGGVALTFSAPVLDSQVKNNVLITPDLAGGRKDYDPWANRRDYSSLSQLHQKGAHHTTWLPEHLKAVEIYQIKTRPADTIKSWFSELPASALEDEFGRTLKQPIDLSFFTDHRLPDFELVHHTAVLEKQIDSEVPLYVTNLDKVRFDYKKLTADGAEDKQSLNIDVNQVQDVQFAIPMRVRDMLGGQSGAVYGVLDSVPHVKKHKDDRTLFASVSPYQMHVKIGHYNTLVWVTDLATGEPVENARVQIYRDKVSQLSSGVKALDKGNTDRSGLVSLKGTHRLGPDLNWFNSWCEEADSEDDCARLFVRVDKAGEMAVMPLVYQFEVDSYRASNNTVWASMQQKYGHIHAWGTTAQGVYRAGGTIQYKLYVRDQNNETYVPAPRESYTLKIVDPTGKTVHEINDIVLSKFGSYSGEYAVPENAAVGWYYFELKADFTESYNWHPMRVLVSDFTPAPFKVVNSLNGDLFHPEQEVEVMSSAKFHSGGPYTDAETRITATLEAAYFSSSHPVAGGFHFDSYQESLSTMVFQTVDNIGEKGEASHQFTLPREDIVFGHLTVESAVRDDRGKYIATSSRADYLAVDRLVGLKHTKWLYEQGKPAQIKYIVVDGQGAPVADTEVTLEIERLQTKVAKVKGAGNAYLTERIDEWIPAGDCEGISKAEPLVCSFTPEQAGSYKITAVIEDSKGNRHSTETRAWVAGQGHVVWDSPDDNSLQIIPEKTEYQIGDKARYLIKNPYPGARALISVERYGVLKSWVQELEGSTPVIEFNVEKDFMPGYYLSVMVVSPRVETPLPEMGQIDLGKPVFKIGYVKVPVTDPYKQIEVSVKTGQQVYKPRDTVTATIHAEPKNKDKKEEIEIAVAVLDEAVLDLIQGGKSYFDPYQGFYKLDNLDLSNYSLLTRLIGRQKFDKKGANPGGDLNTRLHVLEQSKNLKEEMKADVGEYGDGVEDALNELGVTAPEPEKTLLQQEQNIDIRAQIEESIYWADSVTLNKKGEAEIEFRVPDNLTGWRILAFATTPTDRMGLGDTSFKVNRPTEVRPVMPNQLTEGDTFQAGFSVMNRTDKARDMTVTVEVSGDVQAMEAFSETVHIEPYKRKTVYVPVSSVGLAQSRDAKTGAIHFTATAKDAVDGDGIKHTVPVHKRRSLQTAANYGTTTQDEVRESLRFPEKIYSDVGEVSVVLSPSVIGNVDGAFSYMRDYPYICWEQKLSKGVMASHYQSLKDYLPNDLEWEASKTLPDEILKQAANYQAPNGGMGYFIGQDQYVSPYLSAYTALAFNWLGDSGHQVSEAVETKLHDYLERLLRKDVVPSFYSRGMSSTVRAVALAALAKHGKVKQSDLERYRSHVQNMSLFGKAHYLQAAVYVDGGEEIAKEVTDMILSHSYQSGGKFSFNEELDDSYTRILATPLRANCGILSAFTKYGEDKGGASLIGDVPFKLVRSITQTRGNREHWENTQENIFCMNSLIDYSRLYEQVKPDMHVSVGMDTESIGETVFKDLRDDAVTLTRPIAKEDPGTKREVTISREGDGRLYYATRMSYAPLDEQARRLNAGIDIRKEYSVERDGKWVLLNDPNEIKRGELVRVDIYVSLPTARNFVVVDDPVPGGLEPVNRDLATASEVDADKGGFQAAGSSWWFQFNDWHHFNASRWSFYHQELRHNAVRFYSDYLPAGRYHLSYAAQAIAEGEFSKMPVHAEEMYTPDVFGKGLPGTLKVGE